MATPSNSEIGITFIPSDENQALGPKRGNLEGDLGQAFKILSLRLPRVQGARAIAPPTLLNSPGSAGVAGGGNPQAAVFLALLHAVMGRGASPGSLQTPGSGEPVSSGPLIPHVGAGSVHPPVATMPVPVGDMSIGTTPSPLFRRGRGPLNREY